jgi:hypothetical protein
MIIATQLWRLILLNPHSLLNTSFSINSSERRIYLEKWILCISLITKFMALVQRANYADRATVAYLRNVIKTSLSSVTERRWAVKFWRSLGFEWLYFLWDIVIGTYEINWNASSAVLCMQVHAMVPGQRVYGLVMQRRRASSRRCKIGSCQLREKPWQKSIILNDCWGLE